MFDRPDYTNGRLEEHSIRCPFCDESQTLLIDLSAGDQSYIEDCQVCCRPMQVSFATDGETLHYVDVQQAS